MKKLIIVILAILLDNTSARGVETWQMVYEISTGRPISSGTIIASPLPAGFAVKGIDAQPNGRKWNPATLTLDTAPSPRVISVLDFKRRFPTLKLAGIYAVEQTDSTVRMFLDYLRSLPDNMIDLDDPLTQTAMQYVVDNNLLTESEKREVLK